MSFGRVHAASKTFGDETMSLYVYFDKSAVFDISVGDVVQDSRCIYPDKDGSDITICGEAREWFDRELTAGRVKATAVS